MRKVAVVLLAFALLACKSNREQKSEAPPSASQAAPVLASVVHTGDPKSAFQLVDGFYGIEGSWRWAAKSFAVNLHSPAGAAEKGATLQLEFTVPPVVTKQVGPVTLTASIAGNSLPPETYSQPGQVVFKRDVPATLLKSDPVRVDFQLDKAMPPSSQDARELGIVVVSVGLQAK